MFRKYKFHRLLLQITACIWLLCATSSGLPSQNRLKYPGTNVMRMEKYRRKSYQTWCLSFTSWFRCTKYRSSAYWYFYCRSGYSTSDNYDTSCPLPVCGGKIGSNACYKVYSGDQYIQYRNMTKAYNSGGKCSSPDVCTNCNSGFYSNGPYCTMCPQLVHCLHEMCSKVNDVYCEFCKGEIKPRKYFRAYTTAVDNRTCQQACSWRDDSTRCFPGECDQELSSKCRCTAGFEGTHCEIMSQAPNITYNEAKLTDPSNQVKYNPSDVNAGPPQDVVWTNNPHWSEIYAKVDGKYGLTEAPPQLKNITDHFVTTFDYGVKAVSIKFTLERGGGIVGTPFEYICPGMAEKSPVKEFYCTYTFEIKDSNWGVPFENDDKLYFDMAAAGGGFGKYVNRETNTPHTWSLVGKTNNQRFLYRFDLVEPYHCRIKASSSCPDYLTVPDLTEDSLITLSWDGWTDDLSQLYFYEYDLFELGHDMVQLGEHKGVGGHRYRKDNISITTRTSTFLIPDSKPGMYAVHLSAFDKAGNWRTGRKVFLFDNESSVDIVNQPGKVTKVITASEETNYTWVVENTNTVRVEWKGRFRNTRHENARWLLPVASLKNISYDDNDGNRSVAEVYNQHAIVEFKVSYELYGLNSMKSSRDLTSIADVKLESDVLTLNWEDGDKLFVTVRAIDIFGKFNEESVTVYRDATPPVIENLWLTKGDRLNVSVHRIEDFKEMTIEWIAYDYHSGIDSIYWRLYDGYNGTKIIHGHENILAQGAAQTMDNCTDYYNSFPRGADCYCTPFWGCYHRHFQVKPTIKTIQGEASGLVVGKDSGVHDTDYFIEISATSKASLTTVIHKKITIDISPPHTGVVYDGIRGTPEVDFQQEKTLHAHWDGFFDRESGVLFYQYGFDTQCIPKANFKLDVPNSGLNETYSLYASHTVNSEGKYYITVVAYNRALDPSDPVCSDGVTIDIGVPRVKEVNIEGARVKGGLIKDSSSSKYFVVGDDRKRRLISNLTSDCINKATQVKDIDMLPLERFPNGTLVYVDGGIFCSNISGVTSELNPVLAKSSMLHIVWNPVPPPAGVYDYEVGLSSTAGSASPDILMFRSTKQHAHTRIMHEDVPDGALFYIIIKTISKSNMENIQTIGPCLMDSTPPDFTGPITVNYTAGYLMATWSGSAFVDAQDSYPLEMQFAIGHEPSGTDVHYYQALKFVGPCTQSSPPTCTATKIEDTDWRLHGHHTYYFTVKAENSAGLTTYGISTAYQHDVQLPSEGLVFDILPGVTSETLLMDVDDIDYQTDTTSISARWTGFEHPHLDVKYKFSVGTTAGAADVVSETDVGSLTSYTATSLSLAAFQTYFVKVKAITDAEVNVEVTSDGVTVVEQNSVLSGIVINDGEPCTMMVDNGNIFKHHDEDNRKKCEEDVDFQSSTTELKAYWTIPDIMQHYTRNCYFAIEEEVIQGGKWIVHRDYEHVGTHNSAKVTDLYLDPGKKYRFKIKLCAALTCYSPLTSDGVMVLSNSPKTGQILIEHQNITQGGGNEEILVDMERFFDPDIRNPVDKYSVIDKYEWAITDQSTTGRIHTKWTGVTGEKLTHSNTRMTFTIILQGELDTSKCRRFSVRGFNKAKLVSVVSSEIKDCDGYDPVLVKPNDITDAVGEPSDEDGYGLPIVLEQNALWYLADRDYTPYHNYISAVWPSLRYNSYTVAVIHYKSNDITTYYKPSIALDLPDPCLHPEAKACATTDQEFYNFKFDDGELENGQKYLVCLHADRTEIQHEKWSQILPDINTCSDGVIVDLTPPVAGDVWISNVMGTEFQTSTSHMYVNWESFRDVEELNVVPHSSGIQDYQLGIGTSIGGNDVVPFYSLGVVNHAALHNMNLQSGHVYYATIIGMDFANRTTKKTSNPVIVDTSSPLKSDLAISISGRHIVSKSEIEACWKGVFIDIESGISYYEWSIGSQPGYDDLMNFTKVKDECGENDKTNPLDLHDGHAYYVSVKAYNKAGLMSLATSWAYIVDTTPPISGYVYDGKSSNPVTRKDTDFQTDMSMLGVYWEGFHDPHTAIKEYYLSVGTCPICQDVIQYQALGIVEEISIDHVHFGPGLTYYSTVTACNTADLCTSATSDGLIMDDSPPSVGLVFDGTMAHDIEYQSLRTYVGAEWFGFADPQSGLAKYEWRAGTVPGSDDIIKERKTHLAMVGVVTNLNPPLPVGKRIYVTVKAYNRAGLFTEASSNGFIVDSTAPIISNGPVFDVNFGIYNMYLIYRTSLKVTWTVSDDESFIERQYLSIRSHIGGEFQLASTSVNGIARDFILTGLNLHDGVKYYVQLISCNGAKICSMSESPGITVDTTPPLRGMFAIKTDHAAELERHIDEWMTWNYNEVNLAWLGFSDIHSGIDYYEVYIGKSYMAADLNKVPGVSQKVNHLETGPDKYDEGKVQTYKVKTVLLDPEIEYIFVSVLAVNKAGLSSPIIHSQFEKIPGGLLSLVRRCKAVTCEGHCVCGAQDKLCQHNGAICNDISFHNTRSLLSVKDVDSFSIDVQYSASNTALLASWYIAFHQNSAPLWYQWSVGYSSENQPEGIFDETSERVWYDANRNDFQIFSTAPGTLLTETETYSFFVRAWYTNVTYAVFKSNGVTIKTVPPSSTSIRGSSVNERMLGSNMKDQDHMKHGFPYTIDWKNKFLNSENSIAHYRVYLSTYPGGHDTYDAADDLPGTVNTLDVKRTYTRPGVKYYSNVVGYGVSGIHHTESSDGFVGDLVKPQAGIAYDGIGLHDLEYQNSSTVVGARWHGFTDTGSGIVSYVWCVGKTKNITECSVISWRNVGLHVSVSKTLSVPVLHGTKIYNKVIAIDSVGFQSPVSVSDGVTVDLTSPKPSYLFHTGSNLLKNPSFEISVKVIMVEEVNSINICTLSADYKPSEWTLLGQSCVSTVATDKNLARNGRSFAYIRGSLNQSLNGLKVGKLYRLNFFSSHILLSTSITSNKEGFVILGDQKHIFMLYNKAYRHDGHGSSNRETISWHRHTFYFEAKDTSTILSIGSVDTTTGIFLDHLTFEEVEKSSDESHGEQVKAHVVSIHEWGSIHGSWAFIEDVSQISDYTWAIGYSQGGTQIQGFESVGRSNFAYNSSVVLVHNSYIYITVIASNTVGIRSVAYSNPILVDLTTPRFIGVYDGRIVGEDQDSWTINEVSVNWKVEDLESGIDFCEWAIGYEPDSSDLQSFQTVPSDTHLMFADFSYSLLTKRTIYTTIRCLNKAGLMSSVTTDGVQISNEAPSSTNAVIKPISLSVTEYPARDNFQSNTNRIKLTWNGFSDNIAIKQYKLNVDGSNLQLSQTTSYPNGQDVMYAEITNLQTVADTEILSVSAVNDRLIQSYPALSNLTVSVDKPVKDANKQLQFNWNIESKEFTVSWDDIFSSPYPLYYEVSAGRVMGGGEIVQWLETNSTSITFGLPPSLTERTKLDVYLFVRAIAAGGLYDDAHGHVTLP